MGQHDDERRLTVRWTVLGIAAGAAATAVLIRRLLDRPAPAWVVLAVAQERRRIQRRALGLPPVETPEDMMRAAERAWEMADHGEMDTGRAYFRADLSARKRAELRRGVPTRAEWREPPEPRL